MMPFAALLLSFASFAALALSMPQHHRDLFGNVPGRSRELRLRGSGWILLTASILPAILDQGISVGIVLWFGVITVSALAVAMLLTYRKRIPAPGFLLFRRRGE